jgi:hypothetical protein
MVGGVGYAAGRSGANAQNHEREQDQAIAAAQYQYAPPAPAPTPRESVAPASSDLTTQLNQLADLKRAGVLTDAEFAAAKEKLLNG